MAATLGVATWRYSPYAVFSIVSPLLTVAVAYVGFRMLRLPPSGGASADGGNQVAWHPAVIEPSDRPSARPHTGDAPDHLLFFCFLITELW